MSETPTPQEVQRFAEDTETRAVFPHPRGQYMLYADHAAALAAYQQEMERLTQSNAEAWGGLRETAQRHNAAVMQLEAAEARVRELERLKGAPAGWTPRCVSHQVSGYDPAIDGYRHECALHGPFADKLPRHNEWRPCPLA
jgi:hypothetical protein